MKILGIETSADETAAGVVENGRRLLSNVVASSLELQKPYGGIVPEIAARSHLEVMLPVIEEALTQANITWDDIDAIAVTQGPGLLGSLLIGILTAQTLAIAKNKPLIPVNHVLAHVYANFITETSLANYELPAEPQAFPALGLIVSGGHTSLLLIQDKFKYQLLGQTLDDAVGEAFDKVAKLLGLPYPGGPSVAQAATDGYSNIKLPPANLTNFNFSFSGLKTAVLRSAQTAVGQDFRLPSIELPKLLSQQQIADLAASFQATAINSLVSATKLAFKHFLPSSIVVGGGVAANQLLRQELAKNLPLKPYLPDLKLCGDNAAMIAACAYYAQSSAKTPEPTYRLSPVPGLSL